MASKIPYFIFLGIIFVTNGTPDNRDNSQHEGRSHYFKQLMNKFLTEGNYDVLLNHHEDRKGTHHEDTTKLTYKGNKPSNRYYKDPYHNEKSNQDVDGNNLNYKHLLNLFNRNRPRNQETVDDQDNISDKISWNPNAERNYKDHSNKIKGLLDTLDNELSINSGNNYEVVCYGEGCDYIKNEVKPNSNEDGYHSSNKNDDDRNNKDIQCGNRCSRKANYLDESMFTKDINHILRSSNNKDEKTNGYGDDRHDDINDRDVKDDVKSDRDKEDKKSDGNNRYDSYNNRYDSDNHRDHTESNMEYSDGTRDAVDNNDNRYDINDNRNYRHEFQCPGNTCGRTGTGSEEETLEYARQLADGVENLLRVVMKEFDKLDEMQHEEQMQQFEQWVADARDEIIEIVHKRITDPDANADYDYDSDTDRLEPLSKSIPNPKKGKRGKKIRKKEKVK